MIRALVLELYLLLVQYAGSVHEMLIGLLGVNDIHVRVVGVDRDGRLALVTRRKTFFGTWRRRNYRDPDYKGAA